MSISMSFESRLRDYLSKDDRLTAVQKQKVIDYLMEQKLNILVVGATGAGKSSTINALFDIESAVVGFGVEPMTMDVKKYDFGNLVLWDSPGLGDGIEEDKKHKTKIIHQLKSKDGDNNYIVDLVMVILDGSSREMNTSYELINDVIIPSLGDAPEERVLVAINQADIAFKGPDGWDYENNMPTVIGYQFLDEKVGNVKQRIKKSTGIDVDPIYYCAGYQGEGGGAARLPFNMAKLLYMIVDRAPTEKRLVLRENISKKKETWETSDGRKDYAAATRESFGFFGAIGALIKGFFGIFG